jgi:hypothetical protein
MRERGEPQASEVHSGRKFQDHQRLAALALIQREAALLGVDDELGQDEGERVLGR